VHNLLGKNRPISLNLNLNCVLLIMLILSLILSYFIKYPIYWSFITCYKNNEIVLRFSDNFL